MTSELSFTITLDADDPRAVARVEEQLRAWAGQQPGVSGLSMLERAEGAKGEGAKGAGASVWRAARREAFGSPLPNPFAPGR